jgi:chemotaxis response regulator CheB
MAFAPLSHLSPTHHSELARLAPLTSMPVQDAVDGASFEADQVYVLPPDRILTPQDGHLRLAARNARECWGRLDENTPLLLKPFTAAALAPK